MDNCILAFRFIIYRVLVHVAQLLWKRQTFSIQLHHSSEGLSRLVETTIIGCSKTHRTGIEDMKNGLQLFLQGTIKGCMSVPGFCCQYLHFNGHDTGNLCFKRLHQRLQQDHVKSRLEFCQQWYPHTTMTSSTAALSSTAKALRTRETDSSRSCCWC